jgi:hypothetical protein
MNLDQKIAELQSHRDRLAKIGRVLRPIDDETLQLLGLIAADAARLGRIVPEVPLYCDLGETAREFIRRSAIQPGDRLVVRCKHCGRY